MVVVKGFQKIRTCKLKETQFSAISGSKTFFPKANHSEDKAYDKYPTLN